MLLDEVTLVHVGVGVHGTVMAVPVLVLHVIVVVLEMRMGVRHSVVLVQVAMRCTHALLPFVGSVEAAPSGRTSVSW